MGRKVGDGADLFKFLSPFISIFFSLWQNTENIKSTISKCTIKWH